MYQLKKKQKLVFGKESFEGGDKLPKEFNPYAKDFLSCVVWTGKGEAPHLKSDKVEEKK